MIEANWGDILEITVRNDIRNPSDGTAVHWHGFLQTNTPWMDGVPAFTQCPIPPGHSFTYRFKAELYGTTWYHAHYSAQFTDGAMGPVIIHGPKNTPYDVDLGPVMLSDWYHSSYLAIVGSVVAPSLNPPIPTSDNNLINGKTNLNCSQVPGSSQCTNNAGLSKFKFQTGKTHRLRLINSGAEGAQQFSVDDHVMTVIANDFVPVQPYNTSVVTLGVGQRTDIIVKATGSPSGAYWMRSNITCANSNRREALAVIYYDKADTAAVPKSTRQSYPPGCFNERMISAYPKAGVLTWPTGPTRSDHSVVLYSSR